MADSALGNLGSDLAFSVSFGIGRELLDAANDAQLSEAELIASVLILSIVMTAFPKVLSSATKELRLRGCFGMAPKPHKMSSTESGLLAFGALLIDIARRIAISLSVQLLAANVRVRQPDRAVRIVSLLSVAVFFLFLEASSSIGLKVRQA